MTAVYLLLGTVFGFVLSRSGAADYGFIQGMFLFSEMQLYGIIAIAVIVAAPGIYLIKRRGRTLLGPPIAIELKPLHRGNIAGTDPGQHRRRQDLRDCRTCGRAGRRRCARHALSGTSAPLRSSAAQGRDGRGVKNAGRSGLVSFRISTIA